MYHQRKRLLCIFTFLLLAGVTASCGSEADNPLSKTQETAVTTAATEAVTEGHLTDAVPALDFGGKEFRTIQQEQATYHFYTDTETGDPINDAIFTQLQTLEERFHVTFKASDVAEYTDVSSTIRKCITAGEDAYDLILTQIFQSGTDAASGYFYDWYTLPHVDFSQPWYVKSIVDASVGNKLYMAESDLVLSYTNQTWLMLYNKTDATALDLPELYDLVEQGAWTMDKLYEFSSGAYADINGDGAKDDGDYYGFASTPGGCLLAGFLYAGEGRMVEVDDSLTLSYPIAEEHAINVLEKIGMLFEENPAAIKKTEALRSTRMSLFPRGNILFEAMLAGDLILEDMRSLNDEFGVLPLPKYDEAQTEYYTVADGGADIMTVPRTISDPELVGAIVEAMSAYSYNYVIPAYMNLALEQKGTRDERSVSMLRMILDSRVIDFGYLYDGNSGYTMSLPSFIKNSGKLKSSIDSKQKAVDRYYQGVIETLTEAE